MVDPGADGAEGEAEVPQPVARTPVMTMQERIVFACVLLRLSAGRKFERRLNSGDTVVDCSLAWP